MACLERRDNEEERTDTMTTLEIPRSLLTVRDAETLQPWADALAERGVNLAACRLIVADDSSSNFNLHRYILESEGGAWWLSLIHI